MIYNCGLDFHIYQLLHLEWRYSEYRTIVLILGLIYTRLIHHSPLTVCWRVYIQNYNTDILLSVLFISGYQLVNIYFSYKRKLYIFCLFWVKMYVWSRDLMLNRSSILDCSGCSDNREYETLPGEVTTHTNTEMWRNITTFLQPFHRPYSEDRKYQDMHLK